MIKRQIHYFLTAVLFFTRIPCPKWVDHSEEILNKSNRYFPLVGILVGMIASLVLVAVNLVFSIHIAILLSMISSIWVTGAFHEDGFADVCDGFGGGWNKERILTIMKDSRLGTFGVIGLIAILGLKYLSLSELHHNSVNLVIVIISGNSISRAIATVLLFTHKYVRDIDTSKVKPTSKKMSIKSLVISFFFGIIPLFFFNNYSIFLVLIPLFFTYLYMSYFFKKWIGGQTGDCAGALQQVSEIVFYLSLLVIWKLF